SAGTTHAKKAIRHATADLMAGRRVPAHRRAKTGPREKEPVRRLVRRSTAALRTGIRDDADAVVQPPARSGPHPPPAPSSNADPARLRLLRAFLLFRARCALHGFSGIERAGSRRRLDRCNAGSGGRVDLWRLAHVRWRPRGVEELGAFRAAQRTVEGG